MPKLLTESDVCAIGLKGRTPASDGVPVREDVVREVMAWIAREVEPAETFFSELDSAGWLCHVGLVSGVRPCNGEFVVAALRRGYQAREISPEHLSAHLNMRWRPVVRQAGRWARVVLVSGGEWIHIYDERGRDPEGELYEAARAAVDLAGPASGAEGVYHPSDGDIWLDQVRDVETAVGVIVCALAQAGFAVEVLTRPEDEPSGLVDEISS